MKQASAGSRGIESSPPWARFVGLLMLLSLCVAQLASAQTGARAGAADVEAAFLINFLRYTQWPEQRPGGAQPPLVVTVVGSEAAADSVRVVAQATSRVDGRLIEVRRLANPRGSLASPYSSPQDREALALLRSSQVVFFHESAGMVSAQVLADLWGHPVLTVSNIPGFTSGGGMLGLVRSSGRIAFEANPTAIRNSRLLVSAKVLKLARRIPGAAR